MSSRCSVKIMNACTAYCVGMDDENFSTVILAVTSVQNAKLALLLVQTEDCVICVL